MHRAVYSRCSVNRAYLFPIPWFSIIRAYDLSKNVLHNSLVETFYLSLVALYIQHTSYSFVLLSICSCYAPILECHFPKLSFQFLPAFQNLTEAPSCMELLVPVSSPKRPIIFSLSASNIWAEPHFGT